MNIHQIRTKNIGPISEEVEAFWQRNPNIQIFHILTIRNGDGWETYVYYEGRLTTKGSDKEAIVETLKPLFQSRFLVGNPYTAADAVLKDLKEFHGYTPK